MSSSLKCGCKIIGDIINLNDDICGRNWNYMMRTFVNMCGKCGDKQLKFQEMENKLIDMEKSRMKMMTEEEEEKDEDDTDYDELKAYLKTLTEEQRIKHRNFETLRNTANGFRPDYRMEKIYKAIKELKEEEDDNDKNQKRNVNSQLDRITMAEFQKRVKVVPVSESESEEEEEDKQSDGNENLIDPYDYWSPRTRDRYDRDMEEMAREAEEEQNENDSVLEEMRWVAREHSD